MLRTLCSRGPTVGAAQPPRTKSYYVIKLKWVCMLSEFPTCDLGEEQPKIIEKNKKKNP